jgi:CheY-like chemotaxis protein
VDVIAPATCTLPDAAVAEIVPADAATAGLRLCGAPIARTPFANATELAALIVLTHGPGGTMRMLIVDDEAMIGRALQRQLRRECVVHTETDPARAIEWVGSVAGTDARFDLVLCDFRMPAMTGLRVAEALRELADPPTFVLMTGFHDMDAPADLVDGVLFKPFDGAQLRAVVAAFTDAGPRRRRPSTLHAA